MSKWLGLLFAVTWGTSLGGYLLRLQEVAFWQLSLRNPRPWVIEITTLPTRIVSEGDPLWCAGSLGAGLIAGAVVWCREVAGSRVAVVVGASTLVCIASTHLNLGTPQAASLTIELVTVQVVLLGLAVVAKRDYFSGLLLVGALLAVSASQGASTGAGTMGALELREHQVPVLIGGMVAAIIGGLGRPRLSRCNSSLIIVCQAFFSITWGHDAFLRIDEQLPPLEGRPLASACAGSLSQAAFLNLESSPGTEPKTRLLAASSQTELDELLLFAQRTHVERVEVVAQKLKNLGLWTAPQVTSAEHCAGCILHPGHDDWADELGRCHSTLTFH